MKPASLVLVHGAGSGPYVFADWVHAFSGVRTTAVDLHEGLVVAVASMHDYAERVVHAATRLPQPVSFCGWSMGGLVALLAANRIDTHSLALIEASPPAEVQGFHPGVVPVPGTFDPEDVYGAFPAGMRARSESSYARGERKRGISVPTVPCPVLVIYGSEFRDERGRALARFYDAEERAFPDLDHWGLVRDPRVRATVARFLDVQSPA